MPTSARVIGGVVVLIAAMAGGSGAGDGPSTQRKSPVVPKTPVLGMSAPVACRQIDGYERYEELPGAAITSEEKLKVYYRPSGFAVDRKGKQYVARFVQDGVIRPRGQKKVVWKKDRILEYEARSDTPPDQIYLSNLVGLKGLAPGEYELTITLRDELRPATDAAATATATLPFRIIPTPPGEPAPTSTPARPGARP